MFRPRWRAVTSLLVAVALALLVDGFVRHGVGGETTIVGSGGVPSLADSRPIVDLSGPDPRAAGVPDHTVALTFDDGPDPTWTPRILDVLRRHQVPATFFVVGAATATHPGLVRAELDAGHEVGAHTFSHTGLGRVPALRARMELTLSQTALAGAAGVNTHLLRLPYSFSAGTLTAQDLKAARRAAHLGYVLVFATDDSEDWRRPGPRVITARSIPPAGRGGVILLHDGGGDRQQTVEALDQLIPKLKADGYRFTTISEIAGLPRDAAIAPAGRLARLHGRGLLLTLRLASAITGLLAWLLVATGLAAIVRGIAVVALARRHARSVRSPAAPAAFCPPVTIVVPAYNEEVGIAAAIRSLAGSNYPDFEVIVVDDGSTDGTAAAVTGLGHERVRLIRQGNAGKPAALNLGIARASHDIIVMVDGDTIFEPDTLRHLVGPLATAEVGAVSGNTKVGNRQGLLGRWQHIEYVMGFNLDRRLYDVLGCLPVVPGAVGAFRREALAEVGGVSADTLAEDTDLALALNRAGWRVVYEERARAWTEAPSTLGQLWRQRYRWCYGTMQAVWKHRQALREHTPLGIAGLPYLVLLQVVLPLLGPVLDVFSLYGLAFLNPLPVMGFWLAFNVIQALLAAYAFRLDSEPMRPLWALPLQQFVYRQLMYLIILESLGTALSGRRLRWQKLSRTGVVIAPSHPAG